MTQPSLSRLLLLYNRCPDLLCLKETPGKQSSYWPGGIGGLLFAQEVSCMCSMWFSQN